MARTIDYLTLMVDVTPYEHEGHNYNALNIIVAYRKGRGFCVSWQPVKRQPMGYITGPMPSSDPLVNGGGFVAKEATKNSVKTLEQMRTNLAAAAEGIGYYFDQRDFAGLKELMGDVANYGYPYDREQQIKQLINNNNSKSSTTMATVDMNEKKNAAQQQVTNEVESVSVGEVTLDTIQPAMVPVEGSEYQVKGDDGKEVTFGSVAPNIGYEPAEEAPAVTMPLSNHGTLVIGGVPKRKRQEAKPSATKKSELAGMLTKVRLATYTTKRGETAPRIVGFSGEDDPRWKPIYDEKQALVDAYNKAKKKDPKAKMTSSPFGPAWQTDRETNEKTYCMTFGVRYMDVAQALVEAYNTPDRDAWHRAEQAVRDTKQGIVSDYQAEKAARRAERQAKKAAAQAEAQPQGKVYTEQELIDLLNRYAHEDADALAEVGALLKKAA